MSEADATTAAGSAGPDAYVIVGAGLVRFTVEGGPVELSRHLVASLTEQPELPPPGVVGDIAALLQGQRRRSPGAIWPSPPQLRSGLRLHDQLVLDRLLGEPLLDAATDAVLRLDREIRPLATGVLVGSIAQRAGFRGAAISAAAVRRFAAMSRESVGGLTHDALRRHDPVIGSLGAAYEEWARTTSQLQCLVRPSDVLTLRHLSRLGDLGQRVALAQIGEVVTALARTVPKRRVGRIRDAGATFTALEEESSYPTGGYASLATSGPIENLVTSELATMESDGELDAFDVRWAMGELLRYTRDEAVFVRRRRTITFLLDASLAEARVKDPSLPVQRIVMALGAVATVALRLMEWLGEEALAIRMVFPEAKALLAPEEALLALAVDEGCERDVVSFARMSHLEAWDAATREARRGTSQIVFVRAPSGRAPEKAPERVEVHDVVIEERSAKAWEDEVNQLITRLV